MIAKAGIIALASIVLFSMTLVADDEVLEVAKLRLSIGRTRTMIGVGNELESHELFVIVQNVSEGPVKIWDQWNSWGYHNITLSLKYEDGKTVELKRFGGMIWHQNAPDTIQLAPDEQYVYLVRLKPKDEGQRTNSWGPIGVRNGGHPTVEMQAHFRIPSDDATKLKDVWVGEISSKPASITLIKEEPLR